MKVKCEREREREGERERMRKKERERVQVFNLVMNFSKIAMSGAKLFKFEENQITWLRFTLLKTKKMPED